MEYEEKTKFWASLAFDTTAQFHTNQNKDFGCPKMKQFMTIPRTKYLNFEGTIAAQCNYENFGSRQFQVKKSSPISFIVINYYAFLYFLR